MAQSTIGQAFGFVSTITTRLIGNIKLHKAEEAILGLSQDMLNQLTDEFFERLWAAAQPVVEKVVEPFYLEDTGNRHTMPAGVTLNVAAWVESLKKYDQGSNFRSLVKGRIEENISAGQLRHFRNTREGNGADLVKEVKTVHGGKYSCFADIKTFIESGSAKKDGTWYVFLLEIEGCEWLVFFYWIVGMYRLGWVLHAYHPEDYYFSTAYLFLFRDSLAA